MNDHILVTTKAGVMTIRMNRPDKKNALTGAMYGRMAAAFDEANADASIKAILMLGCPGVFCAGNDIMDFAKAAMSGKRESLEVFDFLEHIIMAQKPIVAGVDGLAIGIGTTMLLHCDYVVASHDSFFQTPFVDLGLVPEAGSSLLAPRLMGHQKAFALLAMGEKSNAQAGYAAGFINQLVQPDELENAAFAAAAAIAEKPQQALKLSRDLIRGDRSDILDRMREEAVLFSKCLESDEAKAAFMAFVSQRQK